MVDYEGELAMVIGRRCQHVPAARAFEAVAGFTIVNDVSARDWQWRTPTFTMGKSFDTHAPCGPELVTLDELGDPGDLGLRTWVNDELRQDSRTSDLIFGLREMIEYLTSCVPARARDDHRHGHPGRRRCGLRSAPVPPGRRRRPHRHRGHRRAAQSGRPGRHSGAGRAGLIDRGPFAREVTPGALARQNRGVPDIAAELSDAERAERLTKLQGIMDLMRPAVQADGGDLVLVRADVETGVVEVQLQGACSSCAVSSATLSGGVERILKERLPWVTEVLGGVDDSLSFDESSALGAGGYVPSL